MDNNLHHFTVSAPDIEPPCSNVQPPQIRLPKGSCDCHAHLFGPQQRYPYQHNRGYTPHDATEEDYRHLLRILGFQRTVLVQPSVYGNDNSLLLDTLATLPDKDDIQWRGIVVVDSSITDNELIRMNALGVRGIRFNILFPGGSAIEELNELAQRIYKFGWHVQLLIDCSEMHSLIPHLTRLPTPVVIDHIGHIPADKGIQNKGFQELLKLLDDGKSWVKISGFNRISSFPQAPFTDINPFVNELLKNFPQRCVFGSDWPHVQLKTPMPNDTDLVNEFLRLVPDTNLQKQILVNNPGVLYSF